MSIDKTVLAIQARAMMQQASMMTPDQRATKMAELISDISAQSPEGGRELVRMINDIWAAAGVPFHLIDKETGEPP
jgi:hypothetical protein